MYNKLFLLGLIISLFLFNACTPSEQYEYAITYKVYYSQDNVQTYFDTCFGNKNQDYHIGSERGSNYIFKCGGGERKMLIDTSAPVEIVSHTAKPVEGSKKNQPAVNDLGFNVNGDGNLIYTRDGHYRELRLVTLEFNSEKHEYVYVMKYGEYTGGVSLSHWAGCKYCKEHKHVEEPVVEPQIEIENE